MKNNNINLKSVATQLKITHKINNTNVKTVWDINPLSVQNNNIYMDKHRHKLQSKIILRNTNLVNTNYRKFEAKV